MTSPEPGWYADDAGQTRWWDGAQWHDTEPSAPAVGTTEELTRRRPPVVPLVAAAIVVVLALVGVTVWFTGRSDDDGGPAATVQRLVDAVRDGDCAAMESATTPEYRDTAHLDCEAVAEARTWLDSVGGEFTVGAVDQSSDTVAEVTVQLAFADDAGEPETTVFTVNREGGRWLVVGDAES